MTHPPKAEFDAYAEGYDSGMNAPLKGLAGAGPDDFIAVKLRWLLRWWPDLATRSDLSILDYGCGAGTLMRLMRNAGIPGAMTGTDISTGMLREAARAWPSGTPQPALHAQNGAETGLPGAAFDLAVISAVLHHVPLDARAAVYAELRRVLKPGGRLVVFEHNPWNPVTRFVVARTPIDADAILLPRTEVSASLREGGWRDIHASDLMFLPPRLGAVATAVERAFSWLPLGGQYAVTARA